MAVVKLKLIHVDGNSDNYEQTLLRCVAEPGFHMDDAADITGASGSVTRTEVNPFTPVLARLNALRVSAGISPERSGMLPADSRILDDEESWKSYLAETESAIDLWQSGLSRITDEKSELETRLHDDERILGQLNHIRSTGANLDQLFACDFFRFRFGRMPRESYDNLSAYTSDIDDMFFFASSVEGREVWGLYFTPRTKAQRIDALFASLNFEHVRISERAHGTPAEAIVQLEQEMKLTAQRSSELDAELKAFTADLTPKLLNAQRTIARLDRIFELQKKVIRTETGFTLAGWIEASRADRFVTELEKAPGVTCKLERARQLDNGVVPPTKLKNPAIFGGFEDFVRMYGLPSYNEIDPTPIVAITYFLFFGLMFGDLGQGAVIILVGALMWFLKKLSLGKVLMCVGVSSMIFGVFYGSVFGMEELIHGFKPNENINTVLFGAVGIGIVMIVAVIIVNIINGIRQKNTEKIFFSHNGLPGLIMYIGAVILVLSMLGFVKTSLPMLPLILLIAVCLLIIFLREPLTKLVAHRKDFIPESKLDFILENFFELFEVVLSFLTNTISFIRIGAFALSHVGMMSVVFLLAETATGYNPVILVIGNLFVIGFEGMIVCIQVLRLEFYELFGRFFEGDGRPFEAAGSISNTNS
ncbi:MAG: hypothetical protein IJ493_07745 [Clostridia bacterium]|nr:hypothetical protein [Clostridia bacterium]